MTGRGERTGAGVDLRRFQLAWAALFVGWSLVTWWLEGRLHTLLRPEAVADRLIYVGVANLLVGVIGSALLVRSARRARRGWPAPSRVRRSIAMAAALVLGGGLVVVQGATTAELWIWINGYAQVLAVTVAEVAVCWWALGAVVETRGSVLASGAVVAVGAVAFGLYHFAHSPPFDTWPMVGGLTVMGIVTSLFYLLSRDLYATVVFHNFAGTLGVTNALAQSGRLADYEEPRVATLVTAVVAVCVLASIDAFVARATGRATDGAGTM